LWETVRDIAESKNVDAIIHGGDIFDRVPTPEEVGIMLEMFKVLRGDWVNIVYPGNHEATSKYKSFWEEFQPLKHEKIEIISEFKEIEDGVFVLPYTDLKKKDWHNKSGKILFTHVRGEIPPHVTAEINLDLFKPWNIVYSGDLHAHSNSQRNIVYPGSPVTTSFHRRETSGDNGVIFIDTNVNDGATYEFIELKLPQLLRLTVTDPADMVRTGFHHTVYELLGDAVELSNVEANDLLDKKIIQREVSARMESTVLTEEEELSWYLGEVEGLESDTIKSIMNEYANLFRGTDTHD